MTFYDLIGHYHPYLVIMAGLVNLSFGLWTMLAAPPGPVRTSLSATAVAIAGYLCLFGSLALQPNDEWRSRTGLMGEFFVHQISPSFYAFSVYLTGRKNQMWLAKITPLIGCAISAMVFHMHGGITFRSFWWGTFLCRPNATALQFTAYYATFFGFTLSSFYNFMSAARTAPDPAARHQYRMIFIAFAIAYLGAWDHLVWMGYHVYPFGYITLTILTVMIVYTTVRYQLMNINPFFQRFSLAALICFFILSIVVPLLYPTLDIFHANSFLSTKDITLLVGLAIGAAFSTVPILYARVVRNNIWVKERLTTGLTHELKSPLGAIQGALEVLSSTPEAAINGPRLRQYLSIIENNGRRLNTLIRDLLVVAQAHEQQFHLKKQQVAVQDMIKDVCELYAPIAHQKGLQLQPQNILPVALSCDAEKIKQTLSNVLSNAIKFSDTGHIVVSTKQSQDQILISVSDQGHGLKKEELTQVFNRFYQGEHTSKGSGIGLTIAKAWVEAHGGKIWVESDGEGKGATVTFALPAVI